MQVFFEIVDLGINIWYLLRKEYDHNEIDMLTYVGVKNCTLPGPGTAVGLISARKCVLFLILFVGYFYERLNTNSICKDNSQKKIKQFIIKKGGQFRLEVRFNKKMK